MDKRFADLTLRSGLRIAASAFVATLLAIAATALAQVPLRLVVSGPAGGAVDVAARQLAEQLRPQYTVVVENPAGAGGQIAVETVRKSAADGNTLLVTPPGVFSIFPHIYPNLPYKTADFAGVAALCTYEFGLAVGPAAKVTQLAAFIAWAKANPGTASFGSPGAGTEPHFIGTELARLAGVTLAHVPYKGGQQAINDLLGGHLPALMSAVPNLVPLHQAGKIRVLVTTGTRRSRSLPDVPTAAEAGFPALSGDLFYAVFAPVRTPAATLDALAASMAKAVATPAFTDAARKLSLEPYTLTRAELDRSITQMSDKWAAVVKRSGFTPDR